MKPGDRVFFAFKDSDGKKITGIYLEMKEDESLTFYAANGQMLRMKNVYKTDFSESEFITMNLKADLSKWLTVKLEYHYDMQQPQFDIVVRYADKENNSYNRTVASTLLDVSTHDSGANPGQFSEFDISYSASGSGKICIDDLYLRNVYVP
jgi:hypothetical protein